MSRLTTLLLIGLLGALIMAALILMQGIPSPAPGEYKYSQMLRNNFTWIALVAHLLAGFVLGYRYQVNPLLVGICLISIFPITAILESTYYRGSHNLIPFEFIVYFIYSLPAASAAFIGKWLNERKQQAQH